MATIGANGSQSCVSSTGARSTGLANCLRTQKHRVCVALFFATLRNQKCAESPEYPLPCLSIDPPCRRNCRIHRYNRLSIPKLNMHLDPVVRFVAAAGVFGLLFGSFLNVCIYRMPRGISVVAPR